MDNFYIKLLALCITAIFWSCTESKPSYPQIPNESLESSNTKSSGSSISPESAGSNTRSNTGSNTRSPRSSDDQGQSTTPQNQPDQSAPLQLNTFDLPIRPKDSTIAGSYVPFVTDSNAVQKDLAELRSLSPTSIPFIRYLTLSYLDYQFEDDSTLVAKKNNYINSLSILLNHLSSDFSISKPIAINDFWSVFRIDIRDYGWSREQWERLVSDDPNNQEKGAYPYANNFDAAVLQIAQEIGTSVPIVRGDWLLTEAGKPDSYHDLVNVPQTLNELEVSIGVDRVGNIINTIENSGPSRTLRVGIGALRSGVSVNNRMLGRHQSFQGYYWLSYDFAAANGDPAKSIFTSPIGPGNEVLGLLEGRDFENQVAFNSDGGEVIWSLNNGLQGYMLVDGNGDRVNEAPTFVVFDPTDREDSGEINNGSQCWECHGGGIITAKDELKDSLEKASKALFGRDVVDAVLRLHPEQKTVNKTINKDNDLFTAAVNKAVMIGTASAKIHQLIDYHEETLGIERLASELSITEDQLEASRELLSDDLLILLDQSRANNLDREDFDNSYQEFVRQIFNL